MALSHLVVQYESNFCTVALQFIEEEKNYPLPSPATTGTASSVNPLSTCLAVPVQAPAQSQDGWPLADSRRV